MADKNKNDTDELWSEGLTTPQKQKIMQALGELESPKAPDSLLQSILQRTSQVKPGKERSVWRFAVPVLAPALALMLVVIVAPRNRSSIPAPYAEPTPSIEQFIEGMSESDAEDLLSELQGSDVEIDFEIDDDLLELEFEEVL